MNERILGFIIWTILSFLIIILGIFAYFRKSAVSFWSNVKAPLVKDVKAYNKAVGKLFIIYGVVLLILGIFLLFDNNSVYILFLLFGVVLETIAVMVIYTLFVEKKYRSY